MGTIYIDDRPVEFEAGQNVLQAALHAGIDAPYFCYHEALGSAGSCRVCAMELEPEKEGTPSRVVMTCMQPAQDGQRYRLNHGRADIVRKHVVEYYMTRHPHDCPVCDEAGECHLQDMTILSQQVYRRYDGNKITFPDQEMGPLIWNTANRCITCYRCARFYQNYALGDDFGVYGIGQRTTFRRAEPGAFDSPFSGNLIDVCPTGTFTDKVYRRKYSRTWQLEKAPSVCGHCSVGCNTEPGGRENTLRRIHPRANSKINPYFICDRGRFGEHFSESADRPLLPMIYGKNTSAVHAFEHIKIRLENARGRVGILTSANEDIETHKALERLAEYYEGKFSAFVMPETEERSRMAMQASMNPPSLTEIENADGAVIIGALTEAAPMMDLAIRQLIAKGKPVYMVHAAPSLLADLINQHSPGHVICTAPKLWATTIKEMNTSEGEVEQGPNLFAHLEAGKNIVLLGVSGEMDVDSIFELHELARGLKNKQLNVVTGFALEVANVAGAVLVSSVGSAQSMLDAVQAGSIDTLVVCGADPFGQGSSLWNPLREKISQLIVLDNIHSITATEADVLLPMATWSERRGITMNYEGRLQAFEQAYYRKDVFSAVEFVSELTDISVKELCYERDLWIADTAKQIVLPGQAGVCVDIATFFGQLDDKDKAMAIVEKKAIVKKQGIQLIRLPWHGGGNKTDHAEALAMNKPWKDKHAYMHSATAKTYSLENQQTIKLKSGIELQVICHDCMAKECLAVTRKTLTLIGYPVNTLLPSDQIIMEGGQL